MADVFISYRHVKPDEDLVAELAKYLTDHRVAHFVDTELRIGQEWIKVIDRELRACQALVVLLSADSIRSDMVREEVKLAHEGKKQIFPVRIGYDGALPYDLGSYLNPIQYKLWRPGEPFAPICGAILDGIRGSWSRDGFEPSPEAVRCLNEVTELRGAPLPSADPRLETGALKLDSPFYVRRPADEKVERLVTQPGETILIKGPRQVGKTSLAARAQATAESNHQQTCYIDFQLIDESRFRDASTLLQYLAARLAKEFRTTLKPKDVWDDMLGDSDSLTDFIQQAVLADTTTPIVLCLDEVDNVFKYPYRDSFFGMLRGWHNRRATHPVWDRLNLLIAHSTEPALFIQDLNQSPFNIGHPFRLGDFDRGEILWLNERHGSPLKRAEDLERLIRLVGGHPYLVRQAFYTLSSNSASVGHLEQIAADDKGPFGDHLRRLLWALRDNDHLRKSLKQVISGRACDDEDDFQRLRAAGLIEGESRQTARPRCDLYASYLRTHL
ncbi:MAG TPA: AAA-like domain-containing protein [Bryobacteraceae bacterium]|jgi:hypothetical protein|nr:AAA-like domain-containing protein [Bryobacteraceae bacterium]